MLLRDTTPSEPKELLELKAKRAVQRAAAPETLEDQAEAAYRARNGGADVGAGAGGAAAAAGVLTAVDEDGEAGEEAEVPRDFDYVTDEEEEGGR